MATSPQWIRLSSGWLDLGHVGSVTELSNGSLHLNSDLQTAGSRTAIIVSGADAAAVRAYLEQVVVNQARPEPQVFVIGDEEIRGAAMPASKEQ